MVLPLIPIAIIAGGSALGLGTYFGLSNQEPDKQISNQYQSSYITQNIDQTKTNEIIIGENSEIGSLVIKDSMSLDANATAEQQQSSKQSSAGGLLSNPLFIAAIVGGGVYLYNKKGGKK